MRRLLLMVAAICILSLDWGWGKSDAPYVQTKTTFQTSREWTPGCDIRADAAMIYGIGGDPCDDGRGNATFEQRADTWAERGYQTHFMTGLAWGEYKDYYTGLWDGKKHFDESQMQRDGDRIMHGVMIPYFVPTLGYIEYLKTHIARVIDYGITEIFLEEPEFWARGGYSEAFKREWQDYYGAPWQAQHESPGSAYLSNKLKYHLYYRAIDKVSSYAKEYGLRKGLDVHIYIPTHSLINYSQWAIVSPEASLASLPGIDGYIAQVWTNTAKEPGFYEGVQREMVFEQAFMEYGCMQSMTAPTGRKMFFLTDPVEDKRRDWAEYKRNYEATFAAQLMYPLIDSYEVMPWPNRIYERKYRKSPDSDEWDYIPADYATQMQVMINSLSDMPLSENKVSGSHGISVLLSNSLMFQRFPTFEGYDDPFLSNLMGQVWPLLKRGVPVGTVHMENLGYPEALKDTRVLLMSYSNMKPMEEVMHRQLADWVKGGGIIIYSGRDDDPYQAVQEWWNSGAQKFDRPSDHLFWLMGIPGGPKEGVYKYGKGRICILRQDPKEYVLKDHGYDRYLETVEKMYSSLGKRLEYKNSFILERGCFDVVAVMDGPCLRLEGDYIDLFDCNLPVVHGMDVAPASQKLLVNLSRIDRSRPCILASATRASDVVSRPGSFSYTAKGPVRITNRSRVYLPSKPSSVLVNGRENYEESRWDSPSGTYLLEFPADPEGTAVRFIW